MDSTTGDHRSVLESKTIQDKNKRTDDRHRAREKLKEKISQSSINRVTYEGQLEAIHSRSARRIPSRVHMNGPGCSTRKGGGKVEPTQTRRSYAEAVKSGTAMLRDKVVNSTRSVRSANKKVSNR